jgi:uncharacterized protein (DUF1015 family)
LIAPPYDTSPTPLTGDGTDRSSFNIAELENIDLSPGGDSHALAATRYRAWLADGVLRRDDQPALYVHDHYYLRPDDGQRRHRRGLLARVRLVDWSERIILPHERTVSGPRNERLHRIRAVRANLSPLYLLYHDRPGTIAGTITAALTDESPVAAGTDAGGGEHTLTRLTDEAVLTRVSKHLADERLFVADGHHRYEAALAYRDEQRAAGAGANDPSEFVLAMLADITDPGVQVRPTHRLVTGLPDFDPRAFRARLEELLTVEDLTSESVEGSDVIGEIALSAAERWRISPRPDRAHERLLPPDQSAAWRRLDVAIGDRVVLEHVLGLDPGRIAAQVTYTHDASQARQAVDAGLAQLALIYAPPSLAALAEVAAAGDTLPPKSTYFDPKPPAGLVINDLSLA